MEKQLGWASKLGGQSLLGSPGWVTQLVRLMESQDMAPPYRFCGGRVQLREMASACPSARHFNLSLYTTGDLQAATLVLELRGSKSE